MNERVRVLARERAAKRARRLPGRAAPRARRSRRGGGRRRVRVLPAELSVAQLARRAAAAHLVDVGADERARAADIRFTTHRRARRQGLLWSKSSQVVLPLPAPSKVLASSSSRAALAHHKLEWMRPAACAITAAPWPSRNACDARRRSAAKVPEIPLEQGQAQAPCAAAAAAFNTPANRKRLWLAAHQGHAAAAIDLAVRGADVNYRHPDCRGCAHCMSRPGTGTTRSSRAARRRRRQGPRDKRRHHPSECRGRPRAARSCARCSTPASTRTSGRATASPRCASRPRTGTTRSCARCSTPAPTRTSR